MFCFVFLTFFEARLYSVPQCGLVCLTYIEFLTFPLLPPSCPHHRNAQAVPPLRWCLHCRCSPGRGYRLPTSALVNLSHGSRCETGNQKLTAIVKPQPSVSHCSAAPSGHLGGLNHPPQSPFLPTQVSSSSWQLVSGDLIWLSFLFWFKKKKKWYRSWCKDTDLLGWFGFCFPRQGFSL